MLPALRHFLRFIDLDETFDKHGFTIKARTVSTDTIFLDVLILCKVGAAFKLNPRQREGCKFTMLRPIPGL